MIGSRRNKEERIDPRVKDVLGLLGVGTVLAACIVFPGLPIVAKQALEIYEDDKRKKELKEWERFNLWRLRALLKRMRDQKIVEVIEEGGEPVVVLTEKGRTKYLRYELEEMMIKKPPRWDGKWRLVIYDIAKYQKRAQEAFRGFLKRLKFFPLQKSVYLYPYPCHDEIEFLRQYYGIGDEVIVLTVEGLENEEAYEKYFGL